MSAPSGPQAASGLPLLEADLAFTPEEELFPFLDVEPGIHPARVPRDDDLLDRREVLGPTAGRSGRGCLDGKEDKNEQAGA